MQISHHYPEHRNSTIHWTEEHCKNLLEIFPHHQNSDGRPNWKKIAELCTEKNLIERTNQQCRQKFCSLVEHYSKICHLNPKKKEFLKRIFRDSPLEPIVSKLPKGMNSELYLKKIIQDYNSSPLLYHSSSDDLMEESQNLSDSSDPFVEDIHCIPSPYDQEQESCVETPYLFNEDLIPYHLWISEQIAHIGQNIEKVSEDLKSSLFYKPL